jgi:hypothetical protein
MDGDSSLVQIPGRLAPPFGRLRLSLELLCLEPMTIASYAEEATARGSASDIAS